MTCSHNFVADTRAEKTIGTPLFERNDMTISLPCPHLRYHPAMQKARALSHSPDDPIGSPSLFRLRLAHPDLDLHAILFQALDALAWVSEQRVSRLRLQGTEDAAHGLLVLSDGCLCTLDLWAKQPAVLAFELHGRRGLLQYDDLAHPGILFQPAGESSQNLIPWFVQCQPKEPETSPIQEGVEKIWHVALHSLSSGEVWQAAEMTV
jgi:predicted dehydrogenase